MRKYADRETGLVDLFIVENRPSNRVHIHPSIRLTIIIIIYISNPSPFLVLPLLNPGCEGLTHNVLWSGTFCLYWGWGREGKKKR